ncbi:MAG: phosphatidate cytidylyltransferase [Acidimicrobiia bacterium]
MSDWRDDEHGNQEWADERDQQPARREGVRVVGGDADDPAAIADPTAPAGRFALPDDGGTWSAPGQQASVGPRGPGDDAQLPHWTEPPTGEVPSALGGGGTGDDFDSWSSGGGPRFRVGNSDWADDDFGGLGKDETTSVGALADDELAEPPRRRGRRSRRGRRGRGGDEQAGGLEGGQAEPPPAPGYEGYGGQYGADQYATGPQGAAPYVSQYGAGEYDEQYGEYGAEPYPEEEHAAPGADLPARVITAVVVAVVALAAFAAGRAPAMLLVTVLVGACAFELYEAFRRAGYHTATAVGLLGCVAIVPLAYDIGERAFPLVGLLVVVFTFLWYLLEVVRARPTINIALTLMVFMWVGFLGAFAGMLLAPDPGGTGLLLGVIICAVGADIVAYFAGRAIGKTPLLPEVSPHKTVEGLVAGGIAAIVLGGIVGSVLHPWADKGIGAGLALGLLVAISAPIGDLAESLIKRDLGLKDLGSFLPGHGGFLDRFDSILFALPAAFYVALQVFS